MKSVLLCLVVLACWELLKFFYNKGKARQQRIKQAKLDKDKKYATKLYIPEEHLGTFWKLYDEVMKEEKSNRSQVYAMWKFINQILPESKGKDTWKLNLSLILRPYIES